MKRRIVLKVLGAGTVAPLIPRSPSPLPRGQPERRRGPAGTPSDPDLLRPTVTWAKQLTEGELVTLSALCDLIIPADDTSPSASAVGVPDFINEWVSAPYDYQRSVLIQLRGGLVWLNNESARRHGKSFASASPAEQAAIADQICYEPRVQPEYLAAARMFDLVRDLTATGFYTTREGMADLRYLGNVPLQKFDGPPPEVLRHLGLA
ncbi:MAG: gluconate 2-dehydrogenase subunit 3 family protein [Gemmatimonadetes bacterium]|nr:gluconate 2-dehydrogenase subunit 3 family protein [Gemmatimonadota bacterium]